MGLANGFCPVIAPGPTRLEYEHQQVPIFELQNTVGSCTIPTGNRADRDWITPGLTAVGRACHHGSSIVSLKVVGSFTIANEELSIRENMNTGEYAGTRLTPGRDHDFVKDSERLIGHSSNQAASP